jgi:hypothetical protein
LRAGTSTVYKADDEQSKFNGASLTYDADGQLTRDATNTYTFDVRHHLTAISGSGAASFVLRCARTQDEKGGSGDDDAVSLRWSQPGARTQQQQRSRRQSIDRAETSDGIVSARTASGTTLLTDARVSERAALMATRVLAPGGLIE